MRCKIYLSLLLGTIFIALFSPGCLSAQIIFERWYGGVDREEGQSVEQTSDGGYILSGYTKSFGDPNGDIYLVKTDAYGDTLWTRTFGGASYEESFCVQQTTDGGYVIAGWTGSFGNLWQVYLVKTDSLGDTLWTKTYGGVLVEKGKSVQQTSDGGYIIAGETNSFGAGGYDFYLVKTDSSGNLDWQQTYGGVLTERGHSVRETSDRGYIITGYTESFGAGDVDIYLVKTDTLGDTLWTKTYGGANSDLPHYGRCVRQTSDGGYVVVGYTNSFGVGAYDVYLVKTDANGDTLWTKTYGGTSSDLGRSVQQTSDGGYIIAGSTENYGAGLYDVWLVKTDANGDTLWTETYGGTNYDYGESVEQTSDGGYIIGGYTMSYGTGEFDLYLIKTGAIGVEEEKNMLPFPEVLFSPTLFSDKISIKFSEASNQSLRITLYNVYGASVLVKSFSYTPASIILKDEKITDLGSGVYFLSASSGKRKIGQVKLIKL